MGSRGGGYQGPIFISLRILHFGILLKYFETGSGQAGKPKIPSKIERLCLIKISLKRVLSNSRKNYIYALNFENVIILHFGISPKYLKKCYSDFIF